HAAGEHDQHDRRRTRPACDLVRVRRAHSINAKTMEHTQAQDRLLAWIDAHFDEEVAFLQDMVRIPTDTPPGDNAPHADMVADKVQAWGWHAEKHAVPAQQVRDYGMQSI